MSTGRVRRVDILDEGQVLVCMTGGLVDLDNALLEALYEWGDHPDSGWIWADEPTSLPYGWSRGAEAEVRQFRKQPCRCGEHVWDVEPAALDPEDPITGWEARGAFWGVLA